MEFHGIDPMSGHHHAHRPSEHHDFKGSGASPSTDPWQSMVQVANNEFTSAGGFPAADTLASFQAADPDDSATFIGAMSTITTLYAGSPPSSAAGQLITDWNNLTGATPTGTIGTIQTDLAALATAAPVDLPPAQTKLNMYNAIASLQNYLSTCPPDGTPPSLVEQSYIRSAVAVIVSFSNTVINLNQGSAGLLNPEDVKAIDATFNSGGVYENYLNPGVQPAQGEKTALMSNITNMLNNWHV